MDSVFETAYDCLETQPGSAYFEQKMMKHFRHAIAHGNIYMNIDEGLREGHAPYFFLTSYDDDDVAAQFKASFTDLVFFAEATCRAHTAATHNKSYQEIGAGPRLHRVTVK